MRSAMMGAGGILSAQEGRLIYGNDQLGFYGQVAAADFITTAALVAAIGTVPGSPIAANANSPWLKFAHKGKILYVAQRPLYTSMSWTQLANALLIRGEKTIQVRGKPYKVRVVQGSAGSPPADSEPRVLLPKVVAPSGEWMKLSLADLGMASGATGAWSFTQYESSSTNCHVFGNGGPAIAGNQPKNTVNGLNGWRPVLELIKN